MISFDFWNYIVACCRKLIVQSAKYRPTSHLPPPLPRGRGASSEASGASSSTALSQQQNRVSATASAAAVVPSTPTNPLPLSSSIDSLVQVRLSHILAQARNVTGALSGVASAFEALSNSSPAALTSTARDILDELDSFKVSVTSSGAMQQTEDSAPNLQEEPPTPASPVQPCSQELLSVYDHTLPLGAVSSNGQSVYYPLVQSTPHWMQNTLTHWKSVSVSKFPKISDVS